jgi:predicted metalloendopeptidase
LAALLIVSCTKEPQSATDPFPLPSGAEAGKDLSIKPGDSFYDYCNGTWLKNTPIPAKSAVGGIYAQTEAMEERIKELRTKVPDIERFYSLMEAASGQPEASKAFIDAQKENALRSEGLSAKNLQQFSGSYYDGGFREMLDVTCYEIGTFFR